MQISFSTVWNDFISFVKNPRLDPLPESFLSQPLKVFPYLLGIDFLLMIPIMAIVGLTGVEGTDHEISKMMEEPLKLAAMAVIAAPIFEELFFRFPIGKWWTMPAKLFGEKVYESSIVNWCKNNFKTIFWLFTLVFASLHFTNFATTVPLYFAPLLVLPQFVLGILLGYIRVGWGLRFSILFHAIHNGIPVFLMLLGKGAALE